MRKNIILISMALALSTVAATAAAAWKTYCNAKYDYCVDYPTFLKALPEDDAASGGQFESGKSPLKMRVWGEYTNWMDGSDMSLAKQRDWDIAHLSNDLLPDSKLVYKPVGKNWYVLSGVSRANTFYQRTIKSASGGSFVTVLLTYPTARKVEFDAVVAHVAKSLH